MPIFKATFFFNLAGNGWTETWCMSANQLNDVQPPASNLAPVLAAFRSTTCTLLGHRISYASFPSPRITLKRADAISGGRGGTGVTPPGPEPAPDALLADVVYGTGQSRGILLRGLADDDVGRDPGSGAPQFDPAFNVLIAQLSQQLSTDMWGFCSVDPTNPQFFVTDFQMDATLPGRWKVFTSALSTLPTVGQPVIFRGVPRTQFPWITGKFLVKAVTPGPPQSFSIDLPANVTPAQTGGADVSRWTYQQWAPVALTVQSLTPTDWRTRKTGRPTNLTRGRARGLRYRR